MWVDESVEIAQAPHMRSQIKSQYCNIIANFGSVEKTLYVSKIGCLTDCGVDMSDFKWRDFAGTVILWEVRWYCKYGVSYHNLEKMLDERGVDADHTAKAAKRFLGKAVNGLKDWQKPLKINTNKAPTYGPPTTELKQEGKLPDETLHRQVK
jgi:hypothetical protein